MGNPIQTFLAVAAVELRTARHLVRTWLFGSLAISVTVAVFGFYAWLEGVNSTTAIGRFGTRFEAGELGGYLLGTMLLALVFLALDVRVRDEHARIAGVVDSRPFANVTLVGGQVAGLAFTAWLPMIVALALVQTFGAVARTIDWWMGNTIEPYSLAALVTIDAIPVLILWSSFLVLLVVVLRNRLVAALTAFFVIGSLVWIIPGTPAYLVEALVPVSNYASHASDLAPRFAGPEVLVQRGALLLLAAGFVVFAAVWHPRVDGSSRLCQTVAATACVVSGGIGIGSLVVQAENGMQQRAAWLAAHRLAAEQEAGTRVDVIRLDGRAGVSPGENLDIDVAVAFEAPRELTALVFSFNPSMRISSLAVGGVETPFSHRDGLLTVDLPEPMPAGAADLLSISATGVPDPRFAHLDGAVDPWRVPARNALSALGREGGIFERSYVGLMPAVHWLPASGANVDRDDPARRARDFFMVDLTVDVPEGWLVASVGARHATDGGAFRFAPEVPVLEVPLFASRFDRRAIVIDGIDVELLAHPDHFRGFRMFDGVEGPLTNHLEEIHQDVANLGLGYSLPAMSLVEVPTRLRTFRGGWLLDGEPGLPGVVPLKENGLPMVRPKYRHLVRPNRRSDQVDALERVFWLFNIASNLDSMAGSGGVMKGFMGSMLATTAASGEGAVALDWICRHLAYELIVPSGHYLEGLKSAHNFDATEARGSAVAGMLAFWVLDDRQSLFQRGRVFVDRPEVWDRALGMPLWNLEPDGDPAGAAHTLGLKGTRIALGLGENLGRHGVATLLAELRERFAGQSYRWSDLVAVGEAIGAPVDAMFGDWLHASATPGFLVSSARVARFADDVTGRPRYASRVQVRNNEAATGAVFLGTDRQAWGERTDPVRVGPHSSVEVSMVTIEPPSQLWLHSYFSLNRAPIQLAIKDDVEDGETSESFVPVRPSDWAPTMSGLVVDDLDPGFSVETDDDVAAGEGLWGLYRTEMEFDQGLPRHWWYLEERLGGAWSREEVYSSWGKYRHTMARAGSGDGERRAVFSTELPHAGIWRLQFHIPTDPVPQMPDMDDSWPPFSSLLGRYDMWLRTAQGDTHIEFDGSGAVGGWNELGEFDIESPRVSVIVSNRTDGDAVIADAIRWLESTPATEPAGNNEP